MLTIGIHDQHVGEALGLRRPKRHEHGGAFSGILRKAEKLHAFESHSFGFLVAAIRAGIHYHPHGVRLGMGFAERLCQTDATVVSRQEDEWFEMIHRVSQSATGRANAEKIVLKTIEPLATASSASI